MTAGRLHHALAAKQRIFGGWVVLSYIGFPFLTLEAFDGGAPIDRKAGVVVMLILVAAAMMFDAFMWSRFTP